MDSKEISLTRISAEERRKNHIQTFFHAWCVGSEITLNAKHYKPDIHVIVDKMEVDGKYYFLLLSKWNKLHIAQIVYIKWHANIVKISRTSKEYLANKELFDSWIKSAKEDIRKEKEEFFEEYFVKYEHIPVSKELHTNEGATLYKFVAKHKHKGEYYFVVRSWSEGFSVAKIAWFSCAKLVFITTSDEEKNKDIFERWLKAAKKKCRKK